MPDRKKLLSALITGAAVGTAAGLLIAPKRGKVTRRFIVKRAARLRNKAQTAKTR